MSQHLYFDNNATTKVDPQVLTEMLPFFSEYYGNASSINHSFGKKAAEAVQAARLKVADLIGAKDREIVFTSGSTESINFAIKGVFDRYQSIGKHIITCNTEHRAVLDVCRSLEKKGAEITYLPVDANGHINLHSLKDAIRKDTVLISIMYANNETGIVHPVEEIAKISKEKGVLFFCDATQAVGKIPISLKDVEIDLLALSAHKIYGPKGTGALYIRRKSKRTQLETLINGGGQESGMRGGTLNVPGIVGLGAAATLCKQVMIAENQRLKDLRNYFESSILKLEQTNVNGQVNNRLNHVSNIVIRHIKAEQIMAKLKDVSMASGSACSTGSLDPSHVLLAMGLSKEDANASLRLSFGRFNTKEEVDILIELLTRVIDELRAASPVWQLYKDGLI